MAAKTEIPIDLLENERKAQVSAYLAEIGQQQYEEAKGVVQSSLSEALTKQLTSRVRKRLAERLIDIALNEKADRTSLEAIREIWDRVEGKSRISVINSRAESDPLMRLLGEVMANEKKLIASTKKPPVIIEGVVRELTDE